MINVKNNIMCEHKVVLYFKKTHMSSCGDSLFYIMTQRIKCFIKQNDGWGAGKPKCNAPIWGLRVPGGSLTKLCVFFWGVSEKTIKTITQKIFLWLWLKPHWHQKLLRAGKSLTWSNSQRLIRTLNIYKCAVCVFGRVRLVERGAPQSLPLMESGKVKLIMRCPVCFFFFSQFLRGLMKSMSELYLVSLFLCHF